MIIHVFTAERYHIVPSITRGFATVYAQDAEQLFVLYGNKQLDEKLYKNQFALVGFTNYVFCYSFWQLVRILRQYRKETLLFHAGDYSWRFTALVLGCKNINWVCWGGGTKISNNLRSKIGAVLKRYMFRRCKSIVTLMEPERSDIVGAFGVSPQKVWTISYTSSNDDESEIDLLCKKLSNQNNFQIDKPVVFLGNSHHWIKSYITMLSCLQHFKGKIKVQCMLNYDFEKGKQYETLVDLGHSLFGEDFQTNESFYNDFSDYVNYMNQCDIYVCAVERQTGLGAISTCMRLGKKIYITGDNLEWVRQAYNAIVFPIELINDQLSFEEFARPLSTEEKLHNYECQVKSKRINREKWHDYLRKIDKNSF